MIFLKEALHTFKNKRHITVSVEEAHGRDGSSPQGSLKHGLPSQAHYYLAGMKATESSLKKRTYAIKKAALFFAGVRFEVSSTPERSKHFVLLLGELLRRPYMHMDKLVSFAITIKVSDAFAT